LENKIKKEKGQSRMLNIVNEDLMSYSTTVTEEKGKSYTKIRVTTSNKLQQYENDERYNHQTDRIFFNKSKVGPSNKIVSRIDELKPVIREIIRISAPLKNIEEFMEQPADSKKVDFELPMSLYINAINKNQPKVEVRCHEQGDDRANLYVVAFPFNGMIKPIPENPQYRIYKGLIASSVKPFFYNNRKYRKILYLIIEINKNLFKPDHKYFTEEINIELESYALFTEKDTEEKKTNYEKFLLKILSANGDYITNWDYNVIDKPVMMNVGPGEPLWITYESSNDNNKKYNSNNKKPFRREGNTMISTNRHGIRKETNINNNRKPQKSYNKPKEEVDKIPSLDKLMMDSGMFDNDAMNRSKKNGGKNTKSGRRNRY
jgi:hypothetical protein